MPITIESFPDQDLTVFTASGPLTYPEQMEVLQKFYRQGPTRHVIWDFSAVTGSRISSDQLAEIISFLKKHSMMRQGGKTALVAPSDLDYGLSRMGVKLAEVDGVPVTLESFRTIAAARAWIKGKDGS